MARNGLTLALALCLLFVTGASAAEPMSAPKVVTDAITIPQLINYQGKLTDSDGDPLTGNYDLGFRMYTTATGGVPFWNETQLTVPVTEGLFNVLLGSNIPIGNLPDGPDCYLEIVVGTETITPRIRLASVPFAYGAKKAADVDDGIITNIKLAADAVNSAKVENGTVADADLTTTGVSAGSYTNSAITVNAQGRVTAASSGATVAPATYRYNWFHTYDQYNGWLCGNTASLFGGVTPLTWSDGNGLASQMSSDPEVLRTLFQKKGYAGRNALMCAETWYSFSSTNGRLFTALFRVKNSTGAPITWTPYFYYTCYYSWSERASIAVNGSDVWNSGTQNGPYSTSVSLSIPANQTSTVIFVSASDQASSTRSCVLAFYNNSLALPNGLQFVDDLDGL